MKSRIFIAFTVLLVLTASCAKELSRCLFTEAQKEVIPYKKGQTISFTDGAGQIVDFTVTEIKTEMYHESIGTHRGDYHAF